MVKIIEQSSVSKTGLDSYNEDGIFVSDKFIAVIDGATSKEAAMYNGLTGGQMVRNIIMTTLKELSGLETHTEGIRMIQSSIEKTFPSDKYFHASASAVIFNILQRTIWMVGDCQAIVNGTRYTNNKIVDDILSQARAMVLNALIMDGANEDQLSLNDIGREMILPFLKLQRKFENKPGIFGYLTFNNESMDEELLKSKVVLISVPENAEIILASDGYPKLMTTQETSEEELAKLIKTDPLCYKINMSTKGLRKGNISYDDRSYIRFTI